MNKQLEKLREDNAKDRAKVETILARIHQRDQKIEELENLTVIGMVREIGMTPEQLAELLAGFSQKKKPKKEDSDLETV